MKTAVLLVNLGTPEEPTHTGVRNFLRPFLSDRRVVNIHPLLWYPILYGIVLPFRSGRVAKLYQSVWTPDGSPMLAYTRAQVCQVQEILDRRLALARERQHEKVVPSILINTDNVGDAVEAVNMETSEGEDDLSSLYQYNGPDPTNKTTAVVVSYAMTYTKPSIANEITRLRAEEGCERIVVIPLFPQYSSTTTAPILSQIGKVYKKDVEVPDLRIVHNYHKRQDYLLAVANSVRRHRAARKLAQFETSNTVATHHRLLIFSYHGIPQACVDAGDPYADHCRYVSERVGEILGLREGEEGGWLMCYQSRFGKAQWLTPYTDDLLRTLPTAAGGCHDYVDVVCPAFAVDCLETLEEIEMCSRGVFMDAGGIDFSVVPCLNATDEHCAVLANIAMDEMHF